MRLVASRRVPSFDMSTSTQHKIITLRIEGGAGEVGVQISQHVQNTQ